MNIMSQVNCEFCSPHTGIIIQSIVFRFYSKLQCICRPGEATPFQTVFLIVNNNTLNIPLYGVAFVVNCSNLFIYFQSAGGASWEKIIFHKMWYGFSLLINQKLQFSWHQNRALPIYLFFFVTKIAFLYIINFFAFIFLNKSFVMHKNIICFF